MSIADIATTPSTATRSETVFADLNALLPCHIKAAMALKDKHPNAVIVSDEFLKNCPQPIADSFLQVLHTNTIREDGYIEVGRHCPVHHHVTVVSDLHFQTLCRRPRQAN